MTPVPPRRRQADRSAATRDALVAAARPLFAEQGYAAVGTEAIAAAAGVTRGAMYHQFPDKTELFAAVFEAVESDLTQRLIETVDGSGLSEPAAVARLGFRAWLDACTEPEVRRIVLLDAPSVLGWARWREIGQRYALSLVEGLLGALMSAGLIAEGPLLPLAHVMMGASDEAALYIAEAADPVAARAEMVTALDRLVDGLLGVR